MKKNKAKTQFRSGCSSNTTTVADLANILACLPDKAPLYFGPSLIPIDGVTFERARKCLYLCEHKVKETR